MDAPTPAKSPTTSRSSDRPAESHPSIWAIIEYYPPNFSGAAIQAHQILSRLADRGFPIHVLTRGDQQAQSLAGQKHERDGVIVHYLPVSRIRNVDHSGWRGFAAGWDAIQRIWREISFQLRIAAILSQEAHRNDIVQWYVVSEFTWMNVVIARGKRLHRFIQISLLGADDPASFPRGRLGGSTYLKLWAFRQADRVIGLSRALVASCLKSQILPDRIVRIPNGVDLEVFRPCQSPSEKLHRLAQHQLDATRAYLVFVGSAIERKGIDVAIDAFRRFAQENTTHDLLIVGPCEFHDRARPDPARQAVVDRRRRELEADGLTHRVHWVGETSDVVAYLQVSDLFFFPTRREGLPNAVAEAMACGLPVLASYLEGITTDLIESGQHGYLVPGHSSDDYAKALAELCANPSELQRMGTAAFDRVVSEFALPRIVEAYANLYESRRSPNVAPADLDTTRAARKD